MVRKKGAGKQASKKTAKPKRLSVKKRRVPPGPPPPIPIFRKKKKKK